MNLQKQIEMVIAEKIESIKFYMGQGYTKEQAIKTVRSDSCLSGLVWQKHILPEFNQEDACEAR